MGSDPGLVLGYGHQHLGHSMTDIVLNHKTQYEKRQEHSDSRINQVQEIVPGTVKPAGQATMNGPDESFKQYSGQTAAYTHDKRQQKKLVLFGQASQKKFKFCQPFHHQYKLTQKR